ncbi:MAG: galactose mutarotase [Clostridiaceae bacterium]|nr:galactose mutarotase [Clostridiaceae bacterium]
MERKKVLDYKDKPIHSYRLENKNGMILEIIDFGCTITNLIVPDKNNNPTDVVLGYQNLETYLDNPFFLGSTIGRYANRIANGQFVFEGKEYQLEKNDNQNHLHGGSNGFWRQIWQNIPMKNGLKFKLVSPDNDEGYPGDIVVYVVFQLSDKNELIINYRVESDNKAFANLTNHSYFNLDGINSKSIKNHQIQINADFITVSDERLIPTGELMPVGNTPFDLRELTTISDHINANFKALELAGGFDHNFVLNQNKKLKAVASSPKSGIKMEMETDCPGVQFYSGNSLDQSENGKNGKPFSKQSGFCLETQFFPDAPNQPNFKMPIIDKEKPLETKTIYRFGII